MKNLHIQTFALAAELNLVMTIPVNLMGSYEHAGLTQIAHGGAP